MPRNQITYSEKYCDDEFEYRCARNTSRVVLKPRKSPVTLQAVNNTGPTFWQACDSSARWATFPLHSTVPMEVRAWFPEEFLRLLRRAHTQLPLPTIACARFYIQRRLDASIRHIASVLHNPLSRRLSVSIVQSHLAHFRSDSLLHPFCGRHQAQDPSEQASRRVRVAFDWSAAIPRLDTLRYPQVGTFSCLCPWASETLQQARAAHLALPKTAWNGSADGQAARCAA